MRKLVIALFALAFTSNGCFRGPLRLPDAATNPDYNKASAWACRPDVKGDACDIDLTAVEMLPDGTNKIVPFAPAENPAVDCFYVYPTVDMGLRPGLHEDLTDKEKPFQTAGIQAARFAEVCRLYAPLYRQVRIGTYGADETTRDFYLEAAYKDVEAAFDHYLTHDNAGRPFVLLSHSQGSHMVSRLLRRRIEKDPSLLEKLVVALPIGGHLGTDQNGKIGGSFQTIPVCTSKEEVGCVLGYRSYPPGTPKTGRDASLKEGAKGVCVHPGDPGTNGPAPLSRTYFPTRLRRTDLPAEITEKAPFVLYRDFYEARCVAYGDVQVLEIKKRNIAGDSRTNPIDFDTVLTRSTLGLHIYDMQFAMGDLIDTVRIRAEAWERKHQGASVSSPTP